MGALQVTEPRLLLTTRPRRPLGKMLREEMHEGKPSASCLDPTPGPGFPLPPGCGVTGGVLPGGGGVAADTREPSTVPTRRSEDGPGSHRQAGAFFQ